MPSLPVRIYRFYAEGFRSMTVGRKLWLIIILKLVVIFGVLRIFFFEPALSGTDQNKSDAVRKTLIERGKPDSNQQLNPFLHNE